MYQHVPFEVAGTFAGVLTLFTAKGLLSAMNQQVLLKVFSVHGRETTGLASVGFLSFRHRSHLNQVVELYQSAELRDTEIINQQDHGACLEK